MQPHLAAKPAVLVPHIRRHIFSALYKLLHLVRRGVVVAADGLVEFVDAKPCAVTLGKRHAVVLDIVPAAALDLGYLVRGAG